MADQNSQAPSEDKFVVELRAQKDAAQSKVTTKKQEVSRLENEQRGLKALVDKEKQQSSSAQHQKGKQKGQAKDIRGDIQKNEVKFKENEKKLAEMKKELVHLEDELKSLAHDLAVVEQSH